MNIRALLARAQRKAEGLMLDACVVRAITGSTTNPDGSVTPTYGTPVYSGKCKLQRMKGSHRASKPTAGGHAWVIGPSELHVPIATVGIESKMRVVITASIEPGNIGREFLILMDDRKTEQTALRFLMDEVIH